MGSYGPILTLSLVGVFVLFVLGKARGVLSMRHPSRRDAAKRFREAKKRARKPASPEARAEALREAATIALDELEQPRVASSLARRADRLAPDDPASIPAVARAMEAAGRYRALESLLYRRLAEAEPGDERFERLLDTLLRLYDGPMRKRHQARFIRKMRARRLSQSG